eukprot:GHVN01106574.1.p1 GENE.GHVN01106574.1~~GHVN01106574.1.p1  ORF type:complete len:117 (-),score=5.80 GHVN01106574.1:504-854(-)
MFVFIADSFGFNNFGVLCGITSVSGGILNLSQLYFNIYIDNDPAKCRTVIICMILASLFCYAMIMFLYFNPRRPKEYPKIDDSERRVTAFSVISDYSSTSNKVLAVRTGGRQNKNF